MSEKPASPGEAPPRLPHLPNCSACGEYTREEPKRAQGGGLPAWGHLKFGVITVMVQVHGDATQQARSASARLCHKCGLVFMDFFQEMTGVG